ncbi:phage tail family protein [Clostridium cellulovorans]|uniref:Tail component family protein n=1 Tax=Clostridium cellulovorans (strain ATCC 35296 / DSM 3052 / OCM 3 / 743B) TaxID=573061 RepID=D9SQ05_CLOC7|nr:phage tail family protein [Clostridium cellulovorans]ADL52141.1 tail component family protein [Clostridium cellulovorans 743B]
MDIITYTNSKGVTININDSFPFRFEDINGADKVANEIDVIKNYKQDGKQITGSSLGERELVITGTIKGDDVNILEDLKRSMIKIFNPNLEGTLTYYIGGLIKSIQCKPQSTVEFKNTGFKNIKRFSVELLCEDPYWKDISSNIASAGSWTKTFAFPLVMTNFKFGVQATTPTILNNVGDVDTGMIIYFKANGSVTNPTLINPINGQYMKVLKAMAAGEVIKVNTNTGQKKITFIQNNTETNITNLMEYGSTFLQLELGGNQLKSSATSGYTYLDVDIEYTPKYLGV